MTYSRITLLSPIGSGIAASTIKICLISHEMTMCLMVIILAIISMCPRGNKQNLNNESIGETNFFLRSEKKQFECDIERVVVPSFKIQKPEVTYVI